MCSDGCVVICQLPDTGHDLLNKQNQKELAL